MSSRILVFSKSQSSSLDLSNLPVLFTSSTQQDRVMGSSERGSFVSAEAVAVSDVASSASVRTRTRMRFMFSFLLIFHRHFA